LPGGNGFVESAKLLTGAPEPVQDLGVDRGHRSANANIFRELQGSSVVGDGLLDPAGLNLGLGPFKALPHNSL
jgi:hypothetical protein